MFTGLIEEVGTIEELRSEGSKARVRVASAVLSRKLKPGDSISVSGVCLTALDIIRGKGFSADLAQETQQRTSLRQLRPGSRVNLELPARAGAPLGGHLVQGHVDATAMLISLEKVSDSNDWHLWLNLPAEVMRYVVPKGSITVEGISLTVAGVDGTKVRIAIIPHTYTATNLSTLQPGAPLNIEVDVLAKYAERALAEKSPGTLTIERLMSEGF